jgi:hypothetical protein
MDIVPLFSEVDDFYKQMAPYTRTAGETQRAKETAGNMIEQLAFNGM